jgi:transcriptional regulator with XRE-family HTH domain
MSRIKVIAETNTTVTLRKTDFRALLQAAEDGADAAAVKAHRAHEDKVGWRTARRNYLTREEADRLLEGESPVRVWREKRGMTQRGLAEAGRLTPSYLAEIETGKKPGSKAALSRIAEILEVPMDDLAGDPTTSATPPLRPVTRAEAAAQRLVVLAEGGGGRDRLEEEARTIVSEWLEIAGRDGVRHQVKAAIETLRDIVTEISVHWARLAIAQDRIHDTGAAKRMRRISDALEAAIDALITEAREP